MRAQPKYVEWKHVVTGVAVFIGMMAGFGAWVTARAESIAGEQAPAIERIEAKVDRILFMLMRERQ